MIQGCFFRGTIVIEEGSVCALQSCEVSGYRTGSGLWVGGQLSARGCAVQGNGAHGVYVVGGQVTMLDCSCCCSCCSYCSYCSCC